eukprot:gene5336-9145_t
MGLIGLAVKFIFFVVVLICLVIRLEYHPQEFEKQKELKFWTDYSRVHVCHPKQFYQPKTEIELIEIIKNVTKHKEHLKIVAAGHAMSPIAMTNDNLVNLDYFNKIIDVKDNLVTVQAGIRLKELVEILPLYGLSLKNVGQILEQSVAGAISTSTHGSTGLLKNGKLNHGSISTQIVSLKIIDSNGNIHVATKTENVDLFKAARCGLGALGVIIEVTIECEKQFNLELTEGRENFFEVLTDYRNHLSSNDYFRFWWVPGSNISRTISFKRTNLPSTQGVFNKFMRFFEVPLLINFLNLGKYIGKRRLMRILGDYALQPKVIIDRSDLALTGPVPEFYTEMEYFFPIEKFQQVHQEFRDYILNSPFEYNFIAEIRFIAADDIWLSPFYKQDSVSISTVLYDQNDIWKDFADGLEKIYKKYNGRAHWGKHNERKASDIKHQYEKWDDFLKVRSKMDPEGTFLNDYLKRVFGL